MFLCLGIGIVRLSVTHSQSQTSPYCAGESRQRTGLPDPSLDVLLLFTRGLLRRLRFDEPQLFLQRHRYARRCRVAPVAEMGHLFWGKTYWRFHLPMPEKNYPHRTIDKSFPQ